MPVIKVCEQCQREFSVPMRRSETVKFCSRECKTEAGRLELKCAQCGGLFERVRNEAKAPSAFCSRDCYHANARGKSKAEKPEAARYYRTCEVCAKSFRVTETRKDTARWCSRKCQSESDVYREEMSLKQRGEKSWRWAGGAYINRGGYIRHKRKMLDTTEVVLNHRRVVEVALAAAEPNHPFLREVDGVKKLRSEIEVHHIDRNRLNNALSNLLAVTKEAHAQIHHRNRKPKPWECWPSNPTNW